MKFKQHELVRLTGPLTIQIPAGYIVTVVDCYDRESGPAYEIEIDFEALGATLVTVDESELASHELRF